MLNFNGTNLTTAISGLNITDVQGRGPIDQDINSVTVPGRPGAYFLERVIPPRTITISVELVGSSLADIRAKVDQLNALLNVKEPKPMTFNDEPNRTYNGIPNGKPNWNELLFTGKGSISFFCADPHKYSTENTSGAYMETTTVAVNGNQDTDPVTTIVLKADTSYISLYNSTTGKLNLVGMPSKPGETTTDKDTLITLEQFTTVTGWTAPASTEDGTIAGTMQAVNGYEFQASSYGTGTGWHGPALKKSLPSSVQDFKTDIYFRMAEPGAGQLSSAGGIVVSLLDGQNNVIAKGSLYKYYPGVSSMYASLRAGKAANGYTAIKDKQLKVKSVSGIFRISRKGTSWYFDLFQKIGEWYAPLLTLDPARNWKDSNSIATAAVTQIQVQIMQQDSIATVVQAVEDAAVWRQNDLSTSQIPYVGKNGDTIVFDHKTNIITRNGVDISKEKAFIGEYWPLVPGNNAIVAEPTSAFTSVTTKWADKWL